MDYRGGRMQGPPPHTSFRPRGGRGNNSINHHPVPNQHHHPSQVAPRLFTSPMNQTPWNTQSPMNTHNAQKEGLNYSQPPYTPDTGYNYTYPSELINSTPQSQSFPTFPHQMFMQPQVFMDPAVCFQSPPMVTTPPMAPPIDTPLRQYHFNSKDNVVHCSSCSHKNILAETEIIKRDERIDNLEKEIQVFQKEMETITAENAALRLKLEAFQPKNSQGKEFEGLTELQKSVVKVKVADNSIKSVIDSESASDDGKKQKPLSPDAAEFSPKTSSESLSVLAISAPAPAEVPVVSAKGVLDEEGDAYIPVQGSEAGTQVEENLFEEASLPGTSDILAPEPEAGAYPAEFPNEDSTTQVQHANWSDEVDKTTGQEDSIREPETEQVDAEVAPEAGETRDEDAPVTSSAHEQNWRENNSQTHNPPDHWQQKGYDRRQNRGNRFKGQAPGFGRGRKYQNDQEQFNDNYRPNYSHNRPDHRGYGNQNNQNHGPRFQRATEENWENRPKDQRDGQRFDGRNNRNQRYSEKSDRYEDDHQKQTHEQETRSREGENRPTEKSSGPKNEEKNTHSRDHRDNSRKNSWSKDKLTRENNDLKDMKESGPQVQWRGKDNTLNFNKDVKKETSLPRDSPNQNQGNYPSRFNRQSGPRVDVPDIVIEISGDLFSSPGEFSLAHCVAQDFRMGSGIAVKFKNDFKRVGELLDQNVQVGGCAHLQDNDRYIFYLVTKEFSSGKPRYVDLRESLMAMKAKCLKFGVKKLAMPRIGCGLDRLEWSRVKSSINEIFQATGMEIRIYDFNVSCNFYKWNQNSRHCKEYSEYTSWPIRPRHSLTEDDGLNLRELFCNAESDPESEINEASQNLRFLNTPKTHRKRHGPKSENYKVAQNVVYNTYNKHKTLRESKSERNEVNKHEDNPDKSKKKKQKHEPKSESDVVNKNKESSGKHKKQNKSYEAESIVDEDIQDVNCSGKSKKRKNVHKTASESDDEGYRNKEHSNKSKRQMKKCESKSLNKDDGLSDGDNQIVENSEMPKKHKKGKRKRKKMEKSSTSEFSEKKSTPVDDKNAQMNDSTDESFEIPHDQAAIKKHSHRNEGVSEAEGNKPDSKSTLSIKYNLMSLVGIAQDTALIFLGTEDGHMDPTAISLNEKHRFEQEYKKADKKVGSVVCIKHKDKKCYDWVFGLIVAKSHKDKVLFTNIEMCCSKLSQLLRRDKFDYAGIEYPQSWSDDKLFFEKILSLFRATLAKSTELWVCYPSQDMDVLKHLRFKDVRDKDRVNDK